MIFEFVDNATIFIHRKTRNSYEALFHPLKRRLLPVWIFFGYQEMVRWRKGRGLSLLSLFGFESTPLNAPHSYYPPGHFGEVGEHHLFYACLPKSGRWAHRGGRNASTTTSPTTQAMPFTNSQSCNQNGIEDNRQCLWRGGSKCLIYAHPRAVHSVGRIWCVSMNAERRYKFAGVRSSWRFRGVNSTPL